MFCDLVGSTALSTRLDPEEMRELLRAYQNAVAGEIIRFEGHVAKFLGDGVLAYFGWPVAYEDAAERGVRAGLAVAEVVGNVVGPDGSKLAARVGIATGLVVVGDLIGEGAAREQAVVGETPNLAARLQQRGAAGRVLIADSTRRLLGGLFELEESGPLELAGFAEPVRAYQVIGESRAEGRFEALHAQRLAPLVGRDQELALLLDRWRLAKEGEGQVVLLAGEPGIGKSRLALALRERIRAEPRVGLRYHGSPYHAHSALWPVTYQLGRAAGLAPDDPPVAKLDKLERMLGRAAVDISPVAPLFADLLAIPADGRYPPLDLTPQQRKARIFRALLEQLDGLARQDAVLMVLEDAHWCDPTTLELFDQTVERVQDLPVLLIVTFRPEFRPPWTSHAHVTLLTLTRLGKAQAAEVVARTAGGKALPREVLEQILLKTDGIPLFIEELTKTVLEAGSLKEQETRYVLNGPLPPLAIPDTLHGSLLARLDRLAAVKDVAQIGAVIGREFDHELLAAVAGLSDSKLADALQQLIEAELIFRRGVPPEARYVFKHALVQDAAYASLLKSRRQQLHARIAEVLATRSPEPPLEVMARHLEEAGRAEVASEAWARSGLAALGRSAMAEAAAAFEHAVRLLRGLPPSAERKRRELALLGPLGVALLNTRGLASADAENIQEQASALAAELGDTAGRFRATWGLWRVYNARAHFSQALAIARELLDQAEHGGDPDLELQARHALWSSHWFRGDLEDVRRHAERGLDLYDTARHGSDAMIFGGHDARECALMQVGNVLFASGYPDQAVARNDQGLAHAMALGQPQVIAHAHNWGSLLLQLMGDVEALRRRQAALLHLVDQYAFANYYPEARMFEAWLTVRDSHDRRAAAAMREHLDRRVATGTAFAQTYFLALVADAWLQVGEPGEALAAANEGLVRAEATGEHLVTAELHRLVGRACLARSVRDTARGEAAFQAALSKARGRSTHLFELRAACDLACFRAEQGDRRKGFDLLAPVYGWFTEGFDTPDLKQAKALLDELRQ